MKCRVKVDLIVDAEDEGQAFEYVDALVNGFDLPHGSSIMKDRILSVKRTRTKTALDKKLGYR